MACTIVFKASYPGKQLHGKDAVTLHLAFSKGKLKLNGEVVEPADSLVNNDLHMPKMKKHVEGNDAKLNELLLLKEAAVNEGMKMMLPVGMQNAAGVPGIVGVVAMYLAAGKDVPQLMMLTDTFVCSSKKHMKLPSTGSGYYGWCDHCVVEYLCNDEDGVDMSTHGAPELTAAELDDIEAQAEFAISNEFKRLEFTEVLYQKAKTKALKRKYSNQMMNIETVIEELEEELEKARAKRAAGAGAAAGDAGAAAGGAGAAADEPETKRKRKH